MKTRVVENWSAERASRRNPQASTAEGVGLMIPWKKRGLKRSAATTFRVDELPTLRWYVEPEVELLQNSAWQTGAEARVVRRLCQERSSVQWFQNFSTHRGKWGLGEEGNEEHPHRLERLG
jgi:hypothetical protein